MEITKIGKMPAHRLAIQPTLFSEREPNFNDQLLKKHSGLYLKIPVDIPPFTLNETVNRHF